MKLFRSLHDVIDGDVLIDACIGQSLLGKPRDRLLIFWGMTDGRMENRRVRGHTGDAIFTNQLLQATVIQKAALDIVQPDALSTFLELL